MYYTIYKITNNTNGKYYIGQHKTENLDDGYMGSGKAIRAAIKKYGIENFSKDILYVFDNEIEMFNKEKELVVIEDNSYNISLGGRGSFDHINNDNRIDMWRKFAGDKTVKIGKTHFQNGGASKAGKIGGAISGKKNAELGISGYKNYTIEQRKIYSKLALESPNHPANKIYTCECGFVGKGRITLYNHQRKCTHDKTSMAS